MRSRGLVGRGIAAAFTVFITACAPVMAPMEGEVPVEARPMGIGPSLVLEVINNTPRDIAVAYEFDAPNAGGAGEGTWPGCEHTSTDVATGGVAGTYTVLIDGDEVVDGSVPQGMVSGYLIHRIVVHPDGRVAADPARWSGVEPEPISRHIGDCG